MAMAKEGSVIWNAGAEAGMGWLSLAVVLAVVLKLA